ncbi:MAG: helix-hairpin-helix domain-containing protein [Pseudomonadota bacterium]
MRLLIILSVLLGPLAHAQLVDPNLASKEQLEALPNASAAVVDAIVAGRPYLSAEQFEAALSGVLDADQRASVYAQSFRQINLNTASEAEIMLIPGMSKRMAHEFEEYRPYKDIEQFRREIGKYVDEDEVARLEQYVFIPLDLNTASREIIMQVPGMSRKMAHEFEEYRPYRDIEQFRREIGKYVDEDEVARLESYVTIE